jgi:cephalosporin hydroxylase
LTGYERPEGKPALSDLSAGRRGDEGLPVAIPIDLGASVSELWRARINHVVWDTYAGVPLVKFPEDLRVYEHLLWLSNPDVVIELGTHAGGGALWLRDRLRTLRAYGRTDSVRVISVDLDTALARQSLGAVDAGFEEEITLLDGDVLDPGLPDRVGAHVPDGARCLVIEDSAHTGEATAAVLNGFPRFVGPGGFLVVEDTCVDVEEMRVFDYWPRGSLAAIDEWLASADGEEFVRRDDLELYGMTCHPGGFLQRRG